MKRRAFITLLGGAAAWPLAARAQRQPIPVVGFLRSTSLADATHLVAAFRRGLNETGYTEGQNVAVEYRAADDDREKLKALVEDFVRLPVAVIVGNTPSALAAKAATKTVPIVFATGSDPVRDGLVASLNRPGGNVTGVSFLAGALGTKRLDLLRQLAPRATMIGMLVDPGRPEAVAERREVEAAAQAIRQQLIVLDVRSDRDIETAFATFAQRRIDALFIGTGAFMNSRRGLLAALALRHGIPATLTVREFAVAGGLMSYGTSITDSYRQVGIYAARILKGEQPASLPVVQSAKFELVINLNTAKALGLEIPPTLLALADEVIQ